LFLEVENLEFIGLNRLRRTHYIKTDFNV